MKIAYFLLWRGIANWVWQFPGYTAWLTAQANLAPHLKDTDDADKTEILLRWRAPSTQSCGCQTQSLSENPVSSLARISRQVCVHDRRSSGQVSARLVSELVGAYEVIILWAKSMYCEILTDSIFWWDPLKVKTLLEVGALFLYNLNCSFGLITFSLSIIRAGDKICHDLKVYHPF